MGGRTLFGLRRVKDFNHTLSLRWYLSCLYPGDCRKQDYQENGQLGCSHDSLQRRALCVPVSYLPMLIVLEEIATAGCFESPQDFNLQLPLRCTGAAVREADSWVYATAWTLSKCKVGASNHL